MSDHRHIDRIFSAEPEECLDLGQMIAYRDGRLPDAEKHHVERHLLNCDLCGMAYEGIAGAGPETAAAGAEAISGMAWERVAERQRKRRRGAIFWVSVAAGVVLLVSVGYFVIRQSGTPDPARIAQMSDSMYRQTSPTLPPLAEGGEAEKDLEAANGLPHDSLADEPRTRREDNFASGRSTYAMKREQPENVMGGADPADAFAETVVTEEDPVTPADNAGPVETPDAKAKGKSDLSDLSELRFSDQPVGDANMPARERRNEQKPRKEITNELKEQEKTISMDYYDYAGNVDMDDAGVSDAEVDALGGVEEAEEATEAEEEVLTTTGSVVPEIASADESRGRKKTSRNKRRDRSSAGKQDSKSAAREPALLEDRRNMPTVADSVADGYTQGLGAYRAGEYRQSATVLRRVTEQTPDNLDAHFYAAASFMNIDQPRAALFHLDRILAVPGSAHYEDAKWYKALALMKLNEMKEARKLLEEIGGEKGKYRDQAKEMLDEL